MRLERLDLTRYGRFTDVRLQFPTPAPGGTDLHVIFGPNEAGKSTMFSAWLDFLYGMPSQSPYSFLHPGPTMRIGAHLSHAGATLDLARRKGNAGTLQDGHGATVPETLLQSALGGLSRTGYTSMFSLDDDTLERGGESILSSRGDLGEMLFSASAGLSGLGPQLNQLRAEIEAFHRPGGRKGVLYDAKSRLAELDRQRRDLDTTAASYQRLGREVAAAEKNWRKASDTENATAHSLRQMRAALAQLPLQDRLIRLRADHAPLAAMPDLPDALDQQFQSLDQTRLALTARRTERATRIDALTLRMDQATHDPAILALREPIAAAEALRAAHDTAQQDLPRRRDEASETAADLTETLIRLGRAGQDAQTLALDPAKLSALRGLLAKRSGIFLALETARSETASAQSRLDAATARLGNPSPPEDLATLSALMTRLRATDPATALHVAQRDRDDRAAQVRTALQTLLPWRGDAQALADMTVPASWQIDIWLKATETCRQGALDADRAMHQSRTAHDTELAEATRRTAGQTAAGTTLADAATARIQREAAWAAHRTALTAPTADAFEVALRADDHITALLAETMATARAEAAQTARQASLRAAVTTAETALTNAITARDTLAADIATTCAQLGLPGAALPDLRQWLALRTDALTRHSALLLAEDAQARAQTALNQAATALQTALGPTAPAGFDMLWAEATARLTTADQQRDARRQLAELQADLTQRVQNQSAAQSKAEIWRTDWQHAAAATTLHDVPHDSLGMGDMLDLLDKLGRDVASLAGLSDRIDKMQQNTTAFRQAVADIRLAADLSAETGWHQILDRLRHAETTATTRTILTRSLSDETEAQAQDKKALTTTVQALHDLGTALNWVQPSGPLADHIAACRLATQLRRDMADLDRDLANAAPTADPDALRLQEAATQADLTLQHTETQERFAALSEARRQLDAVGGDDVVARIEAERANVLNDLRDAAQTHLARRFGLMALEQGLRRYRDSHRSAMLTRASAAFRTLSRGAYAGLAAQPEGSTEVLVALSATGGAKLAADLSKGTRFQLYLALRIAGYHELALSRPTVPFVADDIMETFDDDRAAAAFGLLAEMSRSGQVIYLTHHRHLCDIARAACPDARVTDLQTC